MLRAAASLPLVHVLAARSISVEICVWTVFVVCPVSKSLSMRALKRFILPAQPVPSGSLKFGSDTRREREGSETATCCCGGWVLQAAKLRANVKIRYFCNLCLQKESCSIKSILRVFCKKSFDAKPSLV